MPTYNAILPEIDAAETARYAGLKNSTEFPAKLIQEACREAKILALPQAVWEVYDYRPARGMIASPVPLALTGRSIVSHLAQCQKIAILAVTIGKQLETQVAHLFSAGTYTAGLLLDAAGTTAVEAAANKVNQLIAVQAAKDGFSTVFRFSPGYGDWDIAIQPTILELAGGSAIRMETAPSCMLIPRKSITAVIGLYVSGIKEATPAGCHGHTCTCCSQPNCFARKEPT